jgi:alginate O-acetyltransferase complex protein AlgI
MEFLSLPYALFFLSVLGVYWSVQQQQWRLWLILCASLAFYASLQIQYIPLLLVSIFVNFRLGRELAILGNLSPSSTSQGERGRVRRPPPRKPARNKRFSESDLLVAEQHWNRRRLAILCLGIFLNVALLLGFKYVPFVLSTVGQLLNLPPAQESASWFKENVLAPLGLSFFSFECVAYLIDVYRGAPASKDFITFAAYKFFFPKLISGPITRYQYFTTQLEGLQFPTPDQLTEGLWLIASGAVKKGLLADNLGRFVSVSFESLQRAGSQDIWLATLAYGLQLYLDFSGYVDIARGCAMLLGLNLPENFDFPYFSTSIADFWRKWHITLGDWLRNYLYFPLGGSRQGLKRTCVNLLIVMLVAGIWHGAAWGFIVWGLLHGVALVIHRLTEALSTRVSALKIWWESIPGVVMAWALTQGMVFISWICFRLPNLKDSSWALLHLWGHTADPQFAQKVYVEGFGLQRFQMGLLLEALVAAMAVSFVLHRGLKLELNSPLKILLVPVCFFAVWLLAPEGTPPFIYFDF